MNPVRDTYGMKLIYIVNQRLPIEKAYGVQIAKMGEAFADLGLDLELVVPRRKNPSKKNVFEYFGIKKNFREIMIPSLDFYLPGKLDIIAVSLKSFFSALQLFFYSVLRKSDFIYSRDDLPLFFLSFFKKGLVFEAHRFSKRRTLFYNRFRKKGLKIITISQGLKNEFIKFGINPENILVAHDGVDLDQFNIPKTKSECRQIVGLPEDKRVIGYVGQLKTMGMEKGIENLISSYKILKKQFNDLTMVIVGGLDKDIAFYKDSLASQGLDENEIIFTGQRPHKEIPVYLKSFDVLVMPFPRNQHYALYMSPLKLFEYMVSKRPIVATDLPAIKEILNENNSILVKPDDSVFLTEAIKKLLNSPELTQKIADRAFEDVKNYTWDKRALRILEFIRESK